ncbi:MAG: hypothetical protein JKY45_02485 [Emcibacter sp.]|nr:hypothetical protein [Emcibacter sp.]
MKEQNYTLETPCLEGPTDKIHTKMEFVDALKTHEVFGINKRAILEISTYFFNSLSKPNFAVLKNSKGQYSWGSYYQQCLDALELDFLTLNTSGSAWISHKGNILYCQWASHRQIGEMLFMLDEKEVEKDWLKVTPAYRFGRPLPHEYSLTKQMSKFQERGLLEVISNNTDPEQVEAK